MLAQYVIMGLIIVVYNHLQVLGVSPHVGPTALLHCMREAVAFFVMLRICSLKLSLLSNVTPRNLAEFESGSVVSSTFIGLKLHFLFQVNMMIFVLSALMDGSLVWHQLTMVLMVLRVLSQITSRSLPSARDTRSSANA